MLPQFSQCRIVSLRSIRAGHLQGAAEASDTNFGELRRSVRDVAMFPKPYGVMGRRISMQPSGQVSIRNATRLLSMIHELHKAGYQRLRFRAGMSPSGMHWRCSITHAGNVAADGISFLASAPDDEIADHSSASEDRYFGWEDAAGRSARELAILFIQRFPIIVQKSDGRDWAYAGWLTDVLGRAEHGTSDGLPVFYADYPVHLDPDWLPPAAASSSR